MVALLEAVPEREAKSVRIQTDHYTPVNGQSRAGCRRSNWKWGKMSRLAQLVLASALLWPLAMPPSSVEASVDAQPSLQGTDQLPERNSLLWIDPATGLTWAKRDNGSNVNWNDARNYCADLTLGGFSDWRLPDIDQLARIFDPDAKALHRIKGGISLTGWPWSTTKNRAGEGWYFHFVYGYRTPRIVEESIDGRALCVRQADGEKQRPAAEQEERPAVEQRRIEELYRAQEALNERRAAEQRRAQEQIRAAEQSPAKPKSPVWTDPATGLMWTTHDNGAGVNRNAARSYCADLKLEGHSDWKLPEIDQLEQIYDTDSTRVFSSMGMQFQYHVKGGIELTGRQWSTTSLSAAEEEEQAALMRQLGVRESGTRPETGWTFDFQGDHGNRFPIDVTVVFGKRALCVRRAGEYRSGN
jgi:hypothetical protein